MNWPNKTHLKPMLLLKSISLRYQNEFKSWKVCFITFVFLFCFVLFRFSFCVRLIPYEGKGSSLVEVVITYAYRKCREVNVIIESFAKKICKVENDKNQLPTFLPEKIDRNQSTCCIF